MLVEGHLAVELFGLNRFVMGSLLLQILPRRRHLEILASKTCLSLVFLLLKYLSTTSCIFILSSAAVSIWIKSHFIFFPSLLEHFQSIKVLNSDQVSLKVLVIKLVIGAKAKYFLLFELSHQDFLHLPMGELAVVVQS